MKESDVVYNVIKVKLGENGKMPLRAHASDAGCDIYAAEDCVIGVGELKRVKTDLFMEIPQGYYGDIRPRSSWFSDGCDVSGVIDSGYRGEVKVMIQNHNEFCRKIINKGDRIAQLLILPCPEFHFTEVEELGDSDRGEGGFGSSGK